MTQIAAAPQLFEELDYRENDGIEVWLLWNRETNEPIVVVSDGKTDDFFEVETKGRSPLEVFRHPYAYRRRPSRED
jgi:hypothetical protein